LKTRYPQPVAFTKTVTLSAGAAAGNPIDISSEVSEGLYSHMAILIRPTGALNTGVYASTTYQYGGFLNLVSLGLLSGAVDLRRGQTESLLGGSPIREEVLRNQLVEISGNEWARWKPIIVVPFCHDLKGAYEEGKMNGALKVGPSEKLSLVLYASAAASNESQTATPGGAIDSGASRVSYKGGQSAYLLGAFTAAAFKAAVEAIPECIREGITVTWESNGIAAAKTIIPRSFGKNAYAAEHGGYFEFVSSMAIAADQIHHAIVTALTGATTAGTRGFDNVLSVAVDVSIIFYKYTVFCTKDGKIDVYDEK